MTEKSEVRLSLLKQVLLNSGYLKKEVDIIQIEDIEISEDGLYIEVKVVNDEFSFNIQEYIKYHNYWLAQERQEIINVIING